MKAIYQNQSRPNCSICIESGWAPPEACAECLKLTKEHAEEVDILQLGVGFFANKAVIKRPNGALETIPLSELIIKD